MNNHQGGEDANGNPTYVPVPAQGGSVPGAYDVENRLVALSYPLNPAVYYSYDPTNHRVWRGQSGSSTDEITFWSISGRKLATYQITETAGNWPTPPGMYCTQTGINYYFGGKLIEANNATRSGWVYSDRLGSIGKFYPYGIERPSATTNGTEKFTGYLRDSETGNDYAVNRYESPGTGRFLTPDRAASASASDPGGWNKYAYVGGDPANRRDPSGTDYEGLDDSSVYSVCLAQGTCDDGPALMLELVGDPDSGCYADPQGCYAVLSVLMAEGQTCGGSTASEFTSNGSSFPQPCTGVGDPTQPSAAPSCNVEVGYTPINLAGVNTTFDHLFFDVWNGSSWSVVDGGPQYNPPQITYKTTTVFGHTISIPSGITFGNLITGVTPTGLYGESTNPNAVIFFNQPEPCALVSQIEADGTALNGLVPYWPVPGTGSYNSNSVVFTIAQDVGLPLTLPNNGHIFPGWGDYIPH